MSAWPSRASRTLLGAGLVGGGAILLAAGMTASCTIASPAVVDDDDDDAGPVEEPSPLIDSPVNVPPDAMPPSTSFCSMPGSLVATSAGRFVMPGGSASAPDLTWLTIPVGFCAHYFATVPTVRQLHFAPGGDLFAASPSRGTTGGAANGTNAIVVLPDDDHDGVADSKITFLANLPATQGLLFANGALYYQDDTKILAVPFNPGDRQPSAASTTVTTITLPQAVEHWPRVLDVAMDGTIYVSNGGSQGDVCESTNPVRGAIVKLNADGSTSVVSTGFRNPIAMRCESDHDTCLAVELALDYSADEGGREKLVPIRQGDDWGHPCCATTNLAYPGLQYEDTSSPPDCSGVASETASFVIGHTPFGVDFETGVWPAPWAHRAFVTLHGDAGSWSGARLVAIALDPATGLPLPATELSTGMTDPNDLLEFATGWADGTHAHGRPAPLAFAPDGRLFLGDDNLGTVVWIAPIGLAAQ